MFWLSIWKAPVKTATLSFNVEVVVVDVSVSPLGLEWRRQYIAADQSIQVESWLVETQRILGINR